MQEHSKRNHALFVACEALEERRLFVAFQLLVDDRVVSGPTTVDFGTVEQNKPGTTHKLSFKYIGNTTVDVQGSLSNADNAFQIASGDTGFKTLSNGESYVVIARLLTATPALRDGDFDFTFHEGTDPFETRRHSLIGTVLPSSVGGAENFGSMTNSTKLKSGTIKALIRSDNEGNTLEQSQPYLAIFELPAAQSRIDVSLKGISRPIPNVDNGFTSGKIGFILTRDANNDGQLSVQERERSDAIRFTTNQVQPNGSTTSSAAKTYPAGKYLVHIFTAAMAVDTGNATRELGFELTLKVDDVAPPAFEVRGNNVVVNNNDTSPGEADGTSFGEVDQGAAPTLTFSVKNTGESTLNVDGQRPNVTGDFIIFEDGLNSTIGAGGSDTFKVKLNDTSPGDKTGTIVIQSSNASGGNFTFTIGGRVKAPNLPGIDVTGKGQAIADDDSTPSEADGTKFADFQSGSGDAPLLTFTISNPGNAALVIQGTPSVTGPFTIEDALNSSIASGGSDTFSVRLNNTTAGEKSGQISISSNAPGAASTYTFAIGGTVIGLAPTPPKIFAVVTGSTLTVTGTTGNDTLTSTISGGTFKFTRNGVDSASFSTSAITKILVNMLDGNDSYSSATQLDIKQTINGGNGNDLIRGGKQTDVMNGGDGDDRMDGRTRGDLFNGEGGSDTAIYRQRRVTEPVTVTIDEIANDGGSSDQSKDNVLSSTEHVQGGLGNDHLTGSSKTNRLYGFEGDDVIVGLKGNDTIDGGSGQNNLNGGFGNDTIFSRNSIADIIDGGADTDTLTGDTIDNISNVENKNLA